jgi:hypothetical protein
VKHGKDLDGAVLKTVRHYEGSSSNDQFSRSWHSHGTSSGGMPDMNADGLPGSIDQPRGGEGIIAGYIFESFIEVRDRQPRPAEFHLRQRANAAETSALVANLAA